MFEHVHLYIRYAQSPPNPRDIALHLKLTIVKVKALRWICQSGMNIAPMYAATFHMHCAETNGVP